MSSERGYLISNIKYDTEDGSMVVERERVSADAKQIDNRETVEQLKRTMQAIRAMRESLKEAE